MSKRPALRPCNANLGIEGAGAVDSGHCEPFIVRADDLAENESQPDDGWFTRILTWMVESNAHVYVIVPASFAEAIPRRVNGVEGVVENCICRDMSLRM